MKRIRCCDGCELRNIGCHSHCLEYNSERALVEQEHQAERMVRDEERYFNKRVSRVFPKKD